jgi:Zn-dependent protease
MTGIAPNAILYIVPVLFGVICHEVAHGWVAEKLGDPTARQSGRITLNPLVHIDPVGTIMLPLLLYFINSPFLFGWAKPVPVQFANLRGGRRSMALVSLSGPMTNLLLAILSAPVYHMVLAGVKSGRISEGGLLISIAEPIFQMAIISIRFNLVLMVVNLFPIPPLDGGRVLAGILPLHLASKLDQLERFGMLFVLILIGSGLWGYIVTPILNVLMRMFMGWS